LSPRSIIYTHSYWQSVLDGYQTNFGPVSVGDNSWLGSAAQILPNINVGTGSIILSNSLVVGHVKPYTMVGGVPSKTIKEDLKKNISKKNKEKIIEGLFLELGDWLYTHHFKIKKVNNKKINISLNDENISCILFEERMINKIENTDIIITFNIKVIPKVYKTLFDIDNKTVTGKIGAIEKEIIGFFRRRGIRFYAK